MEFEEYDTPETRTENGVARTPDGGEGAWFKDSEAIWSASFPPWLAGDRETERGRMPHNASGMRQSGTTRLE